MRLQGSTADGNTDLTQRVVDTYFAEFPEFTGFIHGYAPSFTFASSPLRTSSSSSMPGARAGRAYVSFDYYLDPAPSVEEVAADLMELSALNAQSDGAPYFLLVHVREWSDISRVQDVLNLLPAPEFEVMPLDTFLSYAGSDPTFEPHVVVT